MAGVALCLVSTLGGYLLTSALLLKCPGLLHRPKRQRFRCRHISHRGGETRHRGPRGSCGSGVVSRRNREGCWREPGKHNGSFSPELPPYLCKLDVTFQKECHCEGEDNRIPLLKEVFEAFPNTPVNIDIKVNNNVLIKKVSELVSQYKREHLTVWGNVNYEIVEKCHKENADIPILFCLKRVLLLVGLFYTGLLPFIPIREEFLEIPMPSIILKLKEPEKMTRSQKFVIWLADVLLMRKALFDHLTARGIQVYIWVLNEEQEYKRAFDLGATGVMTDYPTKLKEFLHNYSA
ncbi:lysophospholipase D GDPD1 isoform X6 [Chelonia mydas]|uniref:lysophospholipase D GDPD1 isoform X6 n=1 Tax=Chelonia mydas TaxID=8469 RepID=UPI0018A202EF|nr:lysophospholipase D GDPD1 isoform X6 [Chelonia mydas]